MSKGVKVRVIGDTVKLKGVSITSFHKAWSAAREERKPLFITTGKQTFTFDPISIFYAEEY